jgi:hypothetical protein
MKKKPVRVNCAVAVGDDMHKQITALAKEYTASMGFHVSRTTVIRMSLTALLYLRDRKAARNAK